MQKYEKEKNMDTWRSKYIKKDEHMKAHVKKKKDSHVLKIKLMREITHIKEYSIGLALFYPHTCTSWSKGMTSFSLDLSFDLTKYAE